jgi:hypothetical protein
VSGLFCGHHTRDRTRKSALAFQTIADRETVAIGTDEIITKTRAEQLVPITTPLDPATNLTLDNGLTAETSQ